MRVTPFCLLGALCAAACGINTEYVPMNAAPHAMSPRPPASVEMFSSSRPDRPFVEVATIEVKQQGWNRDDAAGVMGALREEAGRRGCDGVIILGPNDETRVSGSTGQNGHVSSQTLKGYRGSCIVYKDTGPAAPAGAPAAPPPPPGPPPAPPSGAAPAPQ